MEWSTENGSLGYLHYNVLFKNDKNYAVNNLYLFNNTLEQEKEFLTESGIGDTSKPAIEKYIVHGGKTANQINLNTRYGHKFKLVN